MQWHGWHAINVAWIPRCFLPRKSLQNWSSFVTETKFSNFMTCQLTHPIAKLPAPSTGTFFEVQRMQIQNELCKVIPFPFVSAQTERQVQTVLFTI